MTTEQILYSTSKAAELLNAGYPLIPLLPGTKVAAVAQWQHTQVEDCREPDAYARGNYGVVIPPNVAIIDVDVKNFAPGRDSFLELLNDLGIRDGGAALLSNTYVVRSRQYGDGKRDGLHIFVHKPDNLHLRKRNENYPGIELLTSGHYVVGAGSTNPDAGGSVYTVINGHPGRLSPLPEGLIELYQRQATRTKERSDATFYDDEFTQKRFTDWLSDYAPLATQGAHGDDTTYKVAAQASDLGLSPLVTFDLLWEHWNPRCMPPWSEEELMAKVSNAYKYGKSGVGEKNPAHDFDPDGPAGPVTSAMSESDAVKAQMFADRQEIMDNLGIREYREYSPRRKQDVLTTCVHNIRINFEIPSHKTFVNPLYKMIYFDQFAGQVFFHRRPPWHDQSEWTARAEYAKRRNPYLPDDYQPLVEWGRVRDDSKALRSKFSDVRWNPSLPDINDAVLVHAQDNAIHPVREYMSGLTWDGVPRIDSLFPYYCASQDNEYTRAIGRCTMIAMVARIFGYGVKHDHVPVLEGPQGQGKSRFVQILGGEWYAEFEIDPTNKDTYCAMLGKLVIELGEMKQNNRHAADVLKAFLSREIDTYRAPYARTALSIPRQCIFIGTMNPDSTGEYLQDTTGNRRYWPVKVGYVRVDELRRDRDQLFAEAVAKYRAGVLWHFTDAKAIRIAESEQARRVTRDAWTDIIDNWIQREDEIGCPHPELSTAHVAQFVLGLTSRQITPAVERRIATSLGELGWVKGPSRLRSKRYTYHNPSGLMDGI